MTAEAWAVSLAAVMIGVLGGLAIALWKRPAAEVDGDLRAQLALQSAELRRLADAAAQRELTAEQLRQGLETAPGAPSRSSAYAIKSGEQPTASSVRSFGGLRPCWRAVPRKVAPVSTSFVSISPSFPRACSHPTSA